MRITDVMRRIAMKIDQTLSTLLDQPDTVGGGHGTETGGGAMLMEKDLRIPRGQIRGHAALESRPA